LQGKQAHSMLLPAFHGPLLLLLLLHDGSPAAGDGEDGAGAGEGGAAADGQAGAGAGEGGAARDGQAAGTPAGPLLLGLYRRGASAVRVGGEVLRPIVEVRLRGRRASASSRVGFGIELALGGEGSRVGFGIELALGGKCVGRCVAQKRAGHAFSKCNLACWSAGG